MPTTNHTVAINVASVARTSSVLLDSLYIRTSIANKGDTATFVIDDNGWVPRDWDTVTIVVNATTVFGGYIVNRQGVGVGNGTNKIGRWAVECRDWSALLDAVVINRAYTDAVDGDIIADLLATYTPTAGFDTVTFVAPVNVDVDIAFENVTLREAFNQLAAVAGAQWHISPAKQVYWYYPLSGPAAAAFNIDTVAPNNGTTFSVRNDSLQYGTDATTIVNRCIVIGGEELTDMVTDVFVADGTQDTFGPLSRKPGSGWQVAWTLPSGGLQFNNASTIGYRPNDKLGGLSEDGGYPVLFDLENRKVSVKLSNGWVPKAGTNVTVKYYALDPVLVTVEDTASQAEYGQVFEMSVYDEKLNTTELATDYAERIIDEYAWGRETISFEVTEHGLLPGRLITFNVPTFDLYPTYNTDALQLENGDYLLLENGDNILLERYGQARKYLIQDVSIRAVPTAAAGQYMVIATVSAGKYRRSLIDSLASLSEFSGGSGRPPARSTPGALSRITSDLGEVIAGRALFTDGGDRAFSWDDFGGHTGAVIGLNDTGGDLRGAIYILQDGIVRAMLGKLDGMESVGSVVPTDWGIWTNNGYFKGAIAANSGNIGGWTIAANAIYANGGTISTGVPPINSSNPGVYMNSAGIFGYGTLGLTFSLPSDPALRPIFSSGTILNTVYEVTTASVIRTGTINPRVQIDNSGIFAYNSGGTLKFSVDSNTGIMTATDGVFSGSVTASRIVGGTVTGSLISGATVSGNNITGGTISGAVFSGGTVTQGTISASRFDGGTVNSVMFTGGTVSLSSGTLTISSAGINNNQSGTAGIYSNSSPLFTRLITNGTVTGYTGMYVSNITGYAEEEIGYGSSPFLVGKKTIKAWGHPFTPLDYALFTIDGSYGFYFNCESIDRLIVAGTAVTFGANLIPDSTGNDRTVGDSSHAVRYLYMKDDGGVTRRVSINSSGVLVVT